MSGDLDAEALLGKLYNDAVAKIKALEDENREWRMGKLHSPVPHLEDVRRLAAEVEELRQRNKTISQTNGARIGELEREIASLKTTADNNARWYHAEHKVRLKTETDLDSARAEAANLRMRVRMLEGEISDDNDAADLAAE